MTDRTEMEKDNAPASDVEQETAATLEKRRRLLKLDIGSVAMVTTLASRSAFGWGGGHGDGPQCGGGCKTPSAYGSINASRPDKKYTCQGRTPGYWKNHDGWPSPYNKNTKFKDVFDPSSPFENKTLLEVLETGGGGDYELGRHIVAALLNAAEGWTSGVLSVNQVKNIWHEYKTKGYFEPTAGVHWDSAQITDYLQSTMPL